LDDIDIQQKINERRLKKEMELKNGLFEEEEKNRKKVKKDDRAISNNKGRL